MPEPFPSPEKPIPVAMGAARMAPATLDQAGGRAAAARAVREGLLRPYDIATAEIAEPTPLWMPFWRIELTLPGFAVDGQAPTIPLMVSARRDFPFAPRLPTLASRLVGKAAFDVPPADTVPADEETLAENGARVVGADVDAEDAVARARELLLEGLAPGIGLPDRFAPEATQTTLVLFPVYWTPYVYRGEARRSAGDDLFFVAVSGRSGEELCGSHPSPSRALAAKLRRALSFDRRL